MTGERRSTIPIKQAKNDLSAYVSPLRRAKYLNFPVCMPPLENGVVVVYMPGGGNRNFVNKECADNFIEKWKWLQPAKWFVERGKQYRELVKVLEDRGIDHIVVPLFGYAQDKFKPPYPGYKVVYHGTIQMILAMEGDIFFDFDAFKCSTYFKQYKDYLLSSDYEFLQPGELEHRKEYLYDKFGVDGTIFIKPDDNDKTFSGTLLEEEKFDIESAQLLSYVFNQGIGRGDQGSDQLIVVCKPWQISTEWRFFVKKGEVITGSQYKKNGNYNPAKEWPKEAEALALQIANEEWQPGPMYCIDVCLSGDEFKLLEIGCWNCAGYYAADLGKIVKAVSEVMDALK